MLIKYQRNPCNLRLLIRYFIYRLIVCYLSRSIYFSIFLLPDSFYNYLSPKEKKLWIFGPLFCSKTLSIYHLNLGV